MTARKPRLKPCPFCGGDAEIRGVALDRVTCGFCRASISRFHPRTAARAWNRRVVLRREKAKNKAGGRAK